MNAVSHKVRFIINWRFCARPSFSIFPFFNSPIHDPLKVTEMMKNIAVVLSYDGTNFNGWQIQKNGPSIQESMENAIFHLLKQKVHVSGVGRTDSGVHARRYVANFHADCTIPMDRLPYALNSFLPEDIAVSGAVEVPEDFDARFNCTKKGIQ